MILRSIYVFLSAFAAFFIMFLIAWLYDSRKWYRYLHNALICANSVSVSFDVARYVHNSVGNIFVIILVFVVALLLSFVLLWYSHQLWFYLCRRIRNSSSYGWYRYPYFLFRCSASYIVASYALTGIRQVSDNEFLTLFVFFLVLCLYFFISWYLYLFLFDIMSEIRYSVWSRFVVRGYRKQFRHLQPQPAEVPVDGSRYNVPIILGSIVLIAEIVACVILL